MNENKVFLIHNLSTNSKSLARTIIFLKSSEKLFPMIRTNTNTLIKQEEKEEVIEASKNTPQL